MKYMWQSLKMGCKDIMHRWVLYLFAVVVVPLAMTAFFVSFLHEGVAERVPCAVVDLDGSSMSRNLVRNLDALQQVDVCGKCESYVQAMTLVKRGDIVGFFMIPEGFGRDVLSGRQPVLTYYVNFGYIVPASLLTEGFTTISLLSNAAVEQSVLRAEGLPDEEIVPRVQPIINNIHRIGNPEMNYGVYLTNSFAPGVLALMVLIVSTYNITAEITRGTSRRWMRVGGNSVVIALVGKLMPLTMLFTIVGWVMQIVFYVVADYPMHGSMCVMFLAMFLLVVACQALSVMICAIVPNPRYALSVCSLVGMLAFSLCGYSFPVENMYPGIGVFSHILPMRYYFLIYVDQALNGLPFVYSRMSFVSLSVFPILALIMLPLLKRAMLRPVVFVP